MPAAVGQRLPLPAHDGRSTGILPFDPPSPIAIVEVLDLVDGLAVGIVQFDLFAGVAQAAGPTAYEIRDVSIASRKGSSVGGDNQKLVRCKVYIAERVAHTGGELPALEVHGLRAAIHQLDELVLIVFR